MFFHQITTSIVVKSIVAKRALKSIPILLIMCASAGSATQMVSAQNSGPDIGQNTNRQLYLPLVSNQNDGIEAAPNNEEFTEQGNGSNSVNPPPPQLCTSQHGNLDSMLAEVVCASQSDQVGAANNLQIETTDNNSKTPVEILIDDEVEMAAVVQELAAIGATHIITHQRLLAANIPLDQLENLSEQASILSIRAAEPPVRSRNDDQTNGPEIEAAQQQFRTILEGSVTGQHVAAIRAERLHVAPFNLDGQGVRIGIISDSYNCYAQTGRTPTAADTVASNDIPNDVVVLREATYYGRSCETDTDEMRGMMELAYDVAPGARYAVASAGRSKVDFVSSINALISWNADIIITDYVMASEAMFQDDIVTQAANNAYDRGIAFVTLSHNHRNHGFQSSWQDADNDGWLEFAAGDETWEFTPTSGSQIRHVLQWDTPYRSISGQTGSTDLYIGVYKVSDDSLVKSADTSNRNGDPYEFLWFEPTADEEYYLKVYMNRGPAPGLLQIVEQNVGRTVYSSPEPNGPTIYGNSMAEGALTVAGSYWWNMQQEYYFNAQGASPILFNQNGQRYNSPVNRAKPDVAAPTGVNTTFFGSQWSADGDDNPNFWGTSASVEIAGAIGALLLEDQPSMSPQTLYNCLRNSAVDMTNTGSGFDQSTGYGHVDAWAAYATCGGRINMPPAIITSGSRTNRVGESVTLAIESEDLDDSSLFFSAVGLPDGLTINSSSGTISGATNSVGSYNVTLTARDNDGATGSKTFNWTIISASDSCGGYGQEAEAGQLSGNFVVANDSQASNGQFITVPSGSGFASFGSENNAVYCFTVSQAGRYRLVGLFDVTNSSNDSVFVAVNGESPVDPYWSLPLYTTYMEKHVTLERYLNNDDLVPVELDLTADTHTVTIYQREDGLRLDRLYLEPMADIFSNAPPVLSNIGDQESDVGTAVNLAISANDTDGNSLTFSATGLPDGLGIDSATGQISGTPDSEGTYSTSITISDGQGAVDSESFTWTIVNTVPTLLGDVNCDGNVNSVDALFVMQYSVDLRTDHGSCPLPDGTNTLNAAMGDVNNSGNADAVDALFILQCSVDIPNIFCSE